MRSSNRESTTACYKREFNRELKFIREKVNTRKYTPTEAKKSAAYAAAFACRKNYYKRAKSEKRLKKKRTVRSFVKSSAKRKAPPISATLFNFGESMRGNDGKMWTVGKSGKSRRWKRK
jgi:hypothetical protein